MDSLMTEFCAKSLLPIGFGMPGGYELLIVAVIFLLLFGGAKLPSLMRNMGRSINEFKAGMQDKPAGPIKNDGNLEREKSDAIEEETVTKN